MPKHYRNLLGAAVLQTRYLLFTEQAIAEVTESLGMGAIVGPAGLGKTFAVTYALESLVGDVVRITFSTGPTPKLVLDRLMGAITGRGPSASRSVVQEQLLDVLAEKPRLVVVGEAQNLNRNCFECLRYLHDNDDTTFALVFDGGDGAWDVLKKERMLRSRIDTRVAFMPLEPEEILELLPTYHQMYEATDPELLLAVDKALARGRLREWAKFTLTASRLCTTLGVSNLNYEIAEAAITKIGTGP